MSIDHIQIAQSTLAMSVYNMVAMLEQPLALATIATRLEMSHLPGLEVADIQEPTEEMVKRGWVVLDPEGCVQLVDTHHRMVRERARSGEGWDGWIVSCPSCKPKYLEDILKEMAA